MSNPATTQTITLNNEIIIELETYFNQTLHHIYGDYLYALHIEGIGGSVWLHMYETHVLVTIGLHQNKSIVYCTCHTPNTEGMLLETIKACLRQLHVLYSINQTNIQKILSKG